MRESSSSVGALDLDPGVEFARQVADGLACDPKRLPTRYLYDALGSQLFEAICELPWYKITRGEQALLAEHAHAVMSDFGPVDTVVELGSGSGAKLSVLLAAAEGCAMNVHLVDVSPRALAQSALTLSRHRSVTLQLHQAPYEVGLREALSRTAGHGPALVLFLGSNIGNLSSDESDRFLREMRAQCRPGDRLLLGADLVKGEADLVLAYDDPLGVTAAFNKNLLARINRELDADFDLELFAHRVLWNAEAARIEVHLESLADQLVCIRAAGCCVQIDHGERIWTESSYKYEPDGVVAMGERAGFVRRTQWIEADSQFALTLFEKV